MMSPDAPYTFYSCPCVDAVPGKTPARTDEAAPPAADEEENRFDPRSPRAKYTLYPIEHLLYCTDCHHIRCARCIVEEVICWYCPNCLFEVPSSTVRSDGNRCTRNCYNCPICTSVLSISSLEKPVEGATATDAGGDGAKPLGGPYFLSCSYCQWSSLDICLQFEKHFNLTGQLQKLLRPASNQRTMLSTGGIVTPSSPVVTSPTRDDEDVDTASRRGSVVSASGDEATRSRIQGDTETIFNNLQNFYRAQLSDTDGTNAYGLSSDYSISSPSSIHRLMNLYSASGRTRRDRPQQVREAVSFNEGLKLHVPAGDREVIGRMQQMGWEGTATGSQRRDQCREDVHFADELRPLATLLRTKKSKRCKVCRQILARPESKISSNRYKIKLLALNNIPKLTLQPANTSSSNHPSFPMQSTGPGPNDTGLLKPLVPVQFIMTVQNPLFDPIKVTLATPSVTPGRVRSKVTILCPEVEVGANTDVWDEALNASGTAESRRRSLMPNAAGDVSGPNATQAEAGKPWAKGRNWTSVIVEVVPGLLPGSVGNLEVSEDHDSASLEEDEDVLEIPVFIRLEYETEAGGDEGAATHRKEDAGKEKREEAFWTVLGAGRIAP